MNYLHTIINHFIIPTKKTTISKKSSNAISHHTITIEGYHIPIVLKRSATTKHIRLNHTPGHDIHISIPYYMSDQTVQLYIRQHNSWILKQYLSKSDSLISSNPDLCDHSREHFLTYKQSALEFCTRKVQQRNQKLWWKYQKITVKSLKTKRWSCSSKWNLNFNYKLMFLPEPMADYIIVHELCHLREMNHGPQFWKLVEEVYGPEWKKWKKIN